MECSWKLSNSRFNSNNNIGFDGNIQHVCHITRDRVRLALERFNFQYGFCSIRTRARAFIVVDNTPGRPDERAN